MYINNVPSACDTNRPGRSNKKKKEKKEKKAEKRVRNGARNVQIIS